MRKIVFKSGKELEIDGIVQSGKTLQISIKSSDTKSIIDMFSNAENTAVMRYYVGTDLICGYAGFKKFVSLKYTPDVIASPITSRRTQPQKAGLRNPMWLYVRCIWKKLKKQGCRRD